VAYCRDHYILPSLEPVRAVSRSPAGAAPVDPAPGLPGTGRPTAPSFPGLDTGAAPPPEVPPPEDAPHPEAEVLAEVARFQAGAGAVAGSRSADSRSADIRHADTRHGERQAAFRRLFERFHRPMERFFARRGVPPEDCRDLTQEALLGIYRGLEGWRPEARFSTWVFHIAATTYLKHLRSQAAAKRRGHEVPVEDASPSEPERQLDAVLGAERSRALRSAVAGLPDAMRRCLLLRIDQDLKYREIAAVLRVSPETVKAHLFQARRRLGSELAGLVGEPEDDAT
jgi:RNA polymerase sigma factor (sigma-70 family)